MFVNIFSSSNSDFSDKCRNFAPRNTYWGNICVVILLNDDLSW